MRQQLCRTMKRILVGAMLRRFLLKTLTYLRFPEPIQRQRIAMPELPV